MDGCNENLIQHISKKLEGMSDIRINLNNSTSVMHRIPFSVQKYILINFRKMNLLEAPNLLHKAPRKYVRVIIAVRV
jgi:hypothetical protein